MPEVDFKVELWVGPYHWLIRNTDAPDYGPTDGLTIVQPPNDGEIYPAPPAMRECNFGIVAESFADYPDLVIGAPVYVIYQSPHDYAYSYAALFTGRIAALSMTPHKKGVIFNVGCVDYRADLAETIVGDTPWPEETVWARMTRIFAAMGVNLPGKPQARIGGVLYPAIGDGPVIAARDVDAQPALDVINDTLKNWPLLFPGSTVPGTGSGEGAGLGYGLAVLTANVDGVTHDLNPVNPWVLATYFENNHYTGVAVLGTRAGKRALVVDPDLPGNDGQVIDACAVDFSATYSLTKVDAVNTVTVTGPGVGGVTPFAVTATDPTEDVKVAATIETDLVSSAVGLTLANMYLPAETPTAADKWTVDQFTILTEYYPGRVDQPAGVVAVAPIPVHQSPQGREWYATEVNGWALTVENARPVFTIQTSPFRRAADRGGFMLAWSSAPVVGVTWNDLHPRDTWDDYRLARSTAT